MLETSGIHDKVARARRRLRLQSAMEAATTASILTSVVALTAVYLIRRGTVSDAAGTGLLCAAAAIVLVGAAIGWARRFPTEVVATRIDRASSLSDRLASACAFEQVLASGEPLPAETEALMRAAIRDANRALPRADAVAASRFSRPRDGRAASLVAVVSLAVAGLALPPKPGPGAGAQVAGVAARGQTRPLDPVVLSPDDVDYAKSIIDDLHRTAKNTGDAELEKLADDLDKTLDKAKRGQISKTALLEALDRAEQRYMQGSKAEAAESLAELNKTGRLLEHNPTTRKLGRALRSGDLGAAQKQLQKLADKLERGDLKGKQRARAAKALAQAAKAFDKRQQQRAGAQKKQIASVQKQLSLLQRRLNKARTQDQKSLLSRRIQNQQRRLKRLRRQAARQQNSPHARRLKRLYRNLRQAANRMRQNNQKSWRVASQNLRDASRATDEVQQEIRKITNRPKVASQLTDLKQAMRRARRKRSRGPRNLFGKNRKNNDYRRRAMGGHGQRRVWRPGADRRLARGMNGNGKPGHGKLGPGTDSYGNQHDSNVFGNATPKAGKTKDTSLQGLQGRGPSRRKAILAAADKGFATRAYRQVYAQYHAVIEDVMHTEKVPSGYKYYIERYFEKIKPTD